MPVRIRFASIRGVRLIPPNVTVLRILCTGPVSADFVRLDNLRVLDLRDNQLFGKDVAEMSASLCVVVLLVCGFASCSFPHL